MLLSLSTTSQHGQRAALQAILDGLATRPLRVLVTLGGPTAETHLNMPPNSTAAGFVPHELVLPYMSAAVSHAGMSTVAMALAAGVPLVCVPLGRNQTSNAERVVAIGAGLTAKTEEIGGVLCSVLDDPRYRAAAEQISANCAALGAGEYATDLILTSLGALSGSAPLEGGHRSICA